jgi:hypothetical protein
MAASSQRACWSGVRASAFSERGLLVGGVQRPVLVELERAALVAHAPAGEVLQAAVGDEGVAFEVEEDIAGCGCGQARQAARGLLCHGVRAQRRIDLPGFVGQRFHHGHGGAAAGHLHARLLAQVPVALGHAAAGLGQQPAFALRDVHHARQPLLLELAHLAAADAGDERGVVVAPALRIAVAPAAADVAMRHRVRVGGRRRRGGQRLLQPRARGGGRRRSRRCGSARCARA